LVSLGNRSQSRRVRSASHIDKISRRAQIRPSIGYINSGYQHAEKNIFDFNSARIDINDNYGVSLTEVRNQLRDISAVHYDAKLKKINFPTNSTFTPQLTPFFGFSEILYRVFRLIGNPSNRKQWPKIG